MIKKTRLFPVTCTFTFFATNYRIYIFVWFFFSTNENQIAYIEVKLEKNTFKKINIFPCNLFLFLNNNQFQYI